MQNFLQELGKGFDFVGRQYRLTTDTGKHFYADLVFYNYIPVSYTHLKSAKSQKQLPADNGNKKVGLSVYDMRINLCAFQTAVSARAIPFISEGESTPLVSSPMASPPGT